MCQHHDSPHSHHTLCRATVCAGIRAADLRDAAAFVDVQRQVASILDGRIIVGHALQNDLEVCRWLGVLQVLHPQLGSLVPVGCTHQHCPTLRVATLMADPTGADAEPPTKGCA
jgi:hypothetical protein